MNPDPGDNIDEAATAAAARELHDAYAEEMMGERPLCRTGRIVVGIVQPLGAQLLVMPALYFTNTTPGSRPAGPVLVPIAYGSDVRGCRDGSQQAELVGTKFRFVFWSRARGGIFWVSCWIVVPGGRANNAPQKPPRVRNSPWLLQLPRIEKINRVDTITGYYTVYGAEDGDSEADWTRIPRQAFTNRQMWENLLCNAQVRPAEGEQVRVFLQHQPGNGRIWPACLHFHSRETTGLWTPQEDPSEWKQQDDQLVPLSPMSFDQIFANALQDLGQSNPLSPSSSASDQTSNTQLASVQLPTPIRTESERTDTSVSSSSSNNSLRMSSSQSSLEAMDEARSVPRHGRYRSDNSEVSEAPSLTPSLQHQASQDSDQDCNNSPPTASKASSSGNGRSNARSAGNAPLTEASSSANGSTNSLLDSGSNRRLFQDLDPEEKAKWANNVFAPDAQDGPTVSTLPTSTSTSSASLTAQTAAAPSSASMYISGPPPFPPSFVSPAPSQPTSTSYAPWSVEAYARTATTTTAPVPASSLPLSSSSTSSFAHAVPAYVLNSVNPPPISNAYARPPKRSGSVVGVHRMHSDLDLGIDEDEAAVQPQQKRAPQRTDTAMRKCSVPDDDNTDRSVPKGAECPSDDEEEDNDKKTAEAHCTMPVGSPSDIPHATAAATAQADQAQHEPPRSAQPRQRSFMMGATRAAQPAMDLPEVEDRPTPQQSAASPAVPDAAAKTDTDGAGAVAVASVSDDDADNAPRGYVGPLGANNVIERSTEDDSRASEGVSAVPPAQHQPVDDDAGAPPPPPQPKPRPSFFARLFACCRPPPSSDL